MPLHFTTVLYRRTKLRILGRETPRDWRKMERVTPRSWVDRAKFAAKKLGTVSGVTDMGCGTMALERYLAPGTLYIPVDLYARDARTIICDFDREPPPETGTPAVACLGLLSHLQHPNRLMAELSKAFDRAIVSYPVIDAPEASSNLRRPISAYATEAFENMLTTAGWQIEQRYAGPSETLWTLVR